MSSKAELSTLQSSLMTQNQLVDALTSHISLYHSQSRSSSLNPNPNPNPRSAILKWFSSLSVHHRRAHLTTVDAAFVRVLVQMLSTRRTRGHGLFIVLSDLLSGDIPSVCFKRSQGLLARVAESDGSQAAVFRSARLFSSQEGAECSSSSSSSGPNCLDSLTVSEEFVADVDKFVEVMDGVSDGRFLRGEESELGSDWVELEWLKDKGYYSVEDFVANRLEVAMRLAWLDHGGGNGKKRGAKLKEKLSAVGVAANVYWRKKGCVDWWDNLDSATKRNVFNSVLSKSARHLTGEIVKAASSASEDELLLFNSGEEQSSRYRFTVNARKSVPTIAADAEFGSNIIPASVSGKPASLSNALNNLIVLRDIVKMKFLFQDGGYDKGKIFFSTLSSICSISDFILRKVRGLLMIISLDCTKFELMAEDKVNSSPVKSKGKGGACSRKKKGRVRNTNTLDPVSRGCEESLNKLAKDMECAISYTEQPELVESKKPTEEPSTAVGVVKAQSSVKKPRRGKGKKRSNGFKDPFQTTSCKRSVVETSSSVISQDERANLASVNLQNFSGGNSANTNANKPISVCASYSNGPIVDDCNTQHIPENKGAECYQLNEKAAENEPMSSTLENSKCNADGNVMPSPLHVLDSDGVSNGDRNIEKPEHSKGHDTRSASSNNKVRVFENKEKHVSRQEQDGTYLSDTTPSSSSHGPPYEWPSAASTYFPPRFPHLPHATDRLHLDVSRNWHCHLPQSFKPALHQRNIEGGCNPVLSRQLPMSVDWPPMVRSVCGFAPSLTCNYDSGFMPRWNCTYPQGFSNRCMELNPSSIDEERKHSEDFTDRPDLTNKHELHDELDTHWLSEDEMDIHAVSGLDYNQYFGGGVMYWDPSDRPAGGFSRPPSLSSDDSSWAWREADMTRAVDDMVSFSPYSTTGLTSPTAPFCSPFDPLGPGHQAMGYVMGGNEVQAKVLHSPTAVTDVMSDEDTSRSLAGLTNEAEGKTHDCLPYHILPPIIIPNMSRDRSRPEFKSSLDAKSPCLPLTRREQPRVKRPPSPVVRCVTRAPRPPPPSPVSDSRKHRGFPTVRSGSSSPRHWGMRGWFHDGASLDEACIYRDGAEVFWPSWRNNFSGNSMIQPLPSALLQDRLIAMSHLARDQEHPDVTLPIQPTELQSCPTRKSSLCMMHTLLHDEIDTFCKQVTAQNLVRKPYLNWAVKRVTRSLQVLWPRSRTNIFGSNSTGLALPTSDVDLVVCLPPVRNLEPIKEAGILEGRNGIKETCLQHAARYLANQDWVKVDSLKTVENTAIPIIMLVVEVPCDLIASSSSNVQSPKEEPTHVPGEEGGSAPNAVISEVLQKSTQMNHDTQKDSISVRLDISFKSPSHTGLQTTELVKKLTDQFPATVPLAMVLKQFLADRSLDQSYSGGLSSFCLILLITRFLQHQHHLGRPINQNYGSLLMNFLYFFGNVFDPRQMRISVRGSGVYIKRERGCSIDPIHIDDPMFPTNNVGRNCFRIHQCIKAFSEAYSVLENECVNLSNDDHMRLKLSSQLLSKVIPSIGIP